MTTSQLQAEFQLQRIADGARYRRDDRAFLLDVAPELPLWYVSSIDPDSEELEDLTTIAVEDLMRNEF